MQSHRIDIGHPDWSTRSLLKGREPLALALLLLFVAVAAGAVIYSVNRSAFLYYGDAASHIVKARQLVDSQHPGIESIGTVWLPLPHFLLVPFVSVDGLFFSGIAGALVGVPCLIGTVVLLFSIIRRLTASSSVAFISACIFCLNPNVVYLSLTPMTEPELFFFVALGGYALLRWLEVGNDHWLMLCAGAVTLASLCRYEAWLLAPFVAVVAGVRAVSLWKQTDKSGAMRMVAVAGLALAGIILWLLWNLIEYGDALQFAPWKYRGLSTGTVNYLQYRQEAVSVTLLRAVLNVFGPVVLLASVVGVIRLLRPPTHGRRWLLYAFFCIPSLFIMAGILTDNVLIDQWWWNWRFVLIFGLFLSVTGGIGLAGFFSKVKSRPARGVAVLGLLAMPVVQMTVPSVSVATYEDAAKIYSGLSKDAAAFGEQLRAKHKEGSIVLFTGSGLGERIMVSSWLPLKDFHIISPLGGLDILGPIRSGDRYVVIGKVRLPDSREAVDYWLSRRELFLRYYDIVSEDHNYLLLERKTGVVLK
jgi:4-amino-4-deoxy-L-arabinose transferase-like glycosyltransferase